MADKYPRALRVSGLPFMVQGWNGTYIRTGNERNGAPEYALYSYDLYLLIPIIGVTIYKNAEGFWMAHRHCDSPSTVAFCKSGVDSKDSPCGRDWVSKIGGDGTEMTVREVKSVESDEIMWKIVAIAGWSLFVKLYFFAK